MEKKDEMINALLSELEIQNDYLANRTLDSIYFGGGTPSLLDTKDLEKIFTSVTKSFTIGASCEITLEANPDDLSIKKLHDLKMSGVNRLSIGVQSFDDQVLKFLNRAHDGTMAISALEKVRNAGFDNISVDLIYAIPGQDRQALANNIHTVLKFSPEHISAYSLTIENKTVFGNWAAKKKIIEVDEEENASQYELLSNVLIDAGYEHYEISNFGKPGLFSHHNSNYWKQEPYLGIGPSAHSYNTLSRQFNVSNNARYLRAIGAGEVPYTREILTRENKINEYVFTTLRTSWGCSLAKLKAEHDFDLIGRHKHYVSELLNKNLATLNNDILQLTFQGKLLADKISLDLMV